MDHEAAVKKILSTRSPLGMLKSRESNTVEFKESFNKGNTAKYAKTMSAYSNNRGGYIIFGVSDKPRYIKGLQNNNFENFNQEQFTEAINSLFAPEIEWECGTITIEVKNSDGVEPENKKLGWIYTYESIQKPVIALKVNESEKISSGDVFYRYRARTQKIRYSEMVKIIEERISREREGLLKLFEVIRKSDTANLGIINYNHGKISTPYGVDVAFDRRLVTQVLRRAKFIKEGSFNETDGKPVLKVTGNIDLAEEVPVPEGNPDDTHPYIQKQLAELLKISPQDVYALVWYYKMKEAKKYHLEITTSKSGKIHKFSDFALQFLRGKLKEFESQPDELDRIRMEYKNRNKTI